MQAGEIIENPVSVIRELLDNSIDAGAKKIKINILEGGKKLIEIIDDGIGMSSEDLRICYKRHTTSKIRNFNDITYLSTLGFRGEALHSIASVSQLEIHSRDKYNDIGNKISIEESEIMHFEPESRNVGTTIRVKNLFYNLPVRAKFLKSDNSEFRQIKQQLIQKMLAFPEKSFILTHNGKEYINWKGSNSDNNLFEIIDYLFGAKITDDLIEIKTSGDIIANKYINLRGYITKPAHIQSNRSNIFVFVNNRFIISPTIIASITRSYEGMIEKGKYPACFLFLDVSPDFIDCNIHPTKKDIKFQNEQNLFSFIIHSIRAVLGESNTSGFNSSFNGFEKKIDIHYKNEKSEILKQKKILIIYLIQVRIKRLRVIQIFHF